MGNTLSFGCIYPNQTDPISQHKTFTFGVSKQVLKLRLQGAIKEGRQSFRAKWYVQDEDEDGDEDEDEDGGEDEDEDVEMWKWRSDVQWGFE